MIVEDSTVPVSVQHEWQNELERVFPGELLDHPLRVGEIARALYNELDASVKDALVVPGDIQIASVMHDIGKRSIPEAILGKRHDLSDDEMATMRTHTVQGYEWLSSGPTHSVSDLAATVALRHHERWDGSGYPGDVLSSISIPACTGLSEKEIPLAARITSIADVYDALRRKRSYKEAWSHEDAVEYVRANSGSQFDPDLVKLFLRIAPSFA